MGLTVPMAEANAAAPTRLTKQEVVNVLDSIPTFNIVTIADTRIMGTMDETGEECVRFWTDPDEAGSALVVAQAMKEDVPLRLAVTPLGTAFALAEGWQQTPSALKLKLHASKTVCETRTISHGSILTLLLAPTDHRRPLRRSRSCGR